jgi:hypothetical protein
MGRMISLPTVRVRLLLLLSVAGFLLVVASSAKYSIEWVPVVDLGLFRLLPIGYWIGVGLMGAAVILGIKCNDERVFFVQVLLIYLGIWGAPSLFAGYPDVWDSYMHYYSSQKIMETGTTIAQGLDSYSANYPGFFTVGATFGLLGGVQSNQLVLAFLQYYPMFAAGFTLLAMYLFVRTYMPTKDYRFALMVSVLANVWVQYNYSPQSMGLAVGLLIFVFLEKEGFRWLLLGLAAFTYVVVSHPTTLFFVILAMVAREIFVAFRHWRSKGRIYEKSWPVLIFLLVWAAWLSTGAQQYSRFLITEIWSKISFIFTIAEETGKQGAQRVGGNIFALGPYLRLAVLGIFMLLLLISIITYLKRGRKRVLLPGGILAMAIIPLFVIPLDILLLQGQVYDRGFLFFALAAPILFTLMFFHRWTNIRKVVAVVLIVAVLAGAASTYYQESLYAVSSRSLGMSEHIVSDMPRGSSVVGGTYPDLVWQPGDWGKFTRVKYFAVYKEPFSNITRDGATGMIFDRTTQLWMTQYGQLNIYDFYLDSINNYTKVYDSGAYEMIYGGVVRG